MDLLEWLSEGFQSVIDVLITILPKSPIMFVESIPEVEKYMGMVNWFIPVYSMIALTEAWLVAVLGWYALQAILRWVKVIE